MEEAVPLREKAFAVLTLLYASTAFIRLLMSVEEFSAVGDENLASPSKRVLWAFTYLIAMCFLVKRRRQLTDALKLTIVLDALLLYVWVSTLWSGTLATSILSAAALTGNSLIGLYFGVRYTLNEFLRLLGWFCGIAVLGTFLSPLFTSEYALGTGEWTGFFANKNGLGMVMMLSFLVFAMLWKSEKDWRPLRAMFAFLSAVLVLLSGSTTCVVILAAFVCVFVGLFLRERVPSWLWWAIAVGLVVVGVALREAIWDGLEGSETFMGRVGMWAMLISMVRDKLMLGFGYGGFWVFGGPAQTIWDSLRVDPADASYAHNGYIQVLVDCGIVGLGLLLGLLVKAIRTARAYFSLTGDGWPIFFLAFLLLHNLTEGTFLARNSVSWLLFVAILIQLLRGCRPEVQPTLQPLASPLRPCHPHT